MRSALQPSAASRLTSSHQQCRAFGAAPFVAPSSTRRCVPLAPQQPQERTRTHQQSRMLTAAAISPAAAAVAVAGVAAAAAWLDAQLKSRPPQLEFSATPFNQAVLERCPTLHSTYRCTPFLTNGHVETILVAKLRKPPGVDYRREILLTKDGGAVALDWEHHGDSGQDLPEDAPVLILFPGLTGGSCDSYVQHAVLQARHAGIRAAVFNSRGTADSPVLTPQFYSASFTGDTHEVVEHVRARFPRSTLFAAGWSLGANILVNYLAEQGTDTPLEAAVSMCNPFDLTISNRHINEGFNRIYNWSLASSLKRIFNKHALLWRGYRGPGQPARVPSAGTIREFDEAITVHSFGWPDVDAYYAGSSSAKRVGDVAIPLLCIQAADDPIAPAEAIPHAALAANPNCVLAVTPTGGHLGWASGAGAPFGEPWTDAAVFEWLSAVHDQLVKQKAAASASSSRDDDANGGSGGAAAAPVQQKQQEREVVTVSATAASSSSNSIVPQQVTAALHAPAVLGQLGWWRKGQQQQPQSAAQPAGAAAFGQQVQPQVQQQDAGWEQVWCEVGGELAAADADVLLVQPVAKLQPSAAILLTADAAGAPSAAHRLPEGVSMPQEAQQQQQQQQQAATGSSREQAQRELAADVEAALADARAAATQSLRWAF